MSLRRTYCFLPLVVLLSCLASGAESPATAAPMAANAASHAVPRLMKFSGTVSGATGTTGVTFALYAQQSGGAPLWLESQNVLVDQNGRYTIFLGANHAEGIPVDLFYSGEARWLGVQADGAAEQSRVLLVSVPYALKAADADTLGGRPVSAFVLTPSGATGTTGTSGSTATSVSSGTTISADAVTVTTDGGTANFLPKWLDGTTLVNSGIYSNALGQVGIGSSSPLAYLHVDNQNTGGNALYVRAGNARSDIAARFFQASSSPTNDLVQYKFAGDASNLFNFFGGYSSSNADGSGGTQQFAIRGDGSGWFAGNVGIGIENATAKLDVAGNISASGLISANNGLLVNGASGTFNHGLSVDGSAATFFSEIDAAGGLVTNSISNFGPCNPCTLTIQAGNVQFGGGVTISGPVHVSGGAIDGASNVSSVDGNFSGNVNVQNLYVHGNMSKPAGTFKIDHPLDPENKYLYHSFVESPDMMNIYDGVVKLNARGEAWVELPAYFEALNQDFRYQLTAMGAPGPNLYVAKKISGNRFKIAGGRRGMEVSWMITGVRHDAYADANRIKVEVEKTGAERGTYLHPELFKKKDGKPVNARYAVPAASAEAQIQHGNQ